MAHDSYGTDSFGTEGWGSDWGDPDWTGPVATTAEPAAAVQDVHKTYAIEDERIEALKGIDKQFPPGRVSTYGAIGRLIGIGPRRVARALSSGGGAVPWYRVVRADGSVAEPVRVEQLARLAAEGIPMRSGRVDLAAVGWPD